MCFVLVFYWVFYTFCRCDCLWLFCVSFSSVDVLLLSCYGLIVSTGESDWRERHISDMTRNATLLVAIKPTVLEGRGFTTSSVLYTENCTMWQGILFLLIYCIHTGLEGCGGPSRHTQVLVGLLGCGSVAEWSGRWTCDQQVVGSNPGLPAASVTKQYNLVPANGWWGFAAGKVTVGLVPHWPRVTDISSCMLC